MQKMTLNKTKELDVFYHRNREKCTNCGHVFREGETAHLGYSKNREAAVLCEHCSILLDETVIRYYWMDKPYDPPKPEDKLWRYMDLAKFISILSTKALYFAPAETFEDPFEGAKGTIESKAQWDEFYLRFFRQAIATAPGISEMEYLEEKLEENAQRLLKELNQTGACDRKDACISCWHCNEYESEAMWKLYSLNVTNAIAIQTTGQMLREALGENPYIDIGKVKYIDYRKEFTAIGTGSFWYKRKAFEHEREVRALVRNYKKDGNGVSIPVDLDKLIQGIYISPYAPKWFEQVVQDVVMKYEINKEIKHSTMIDIPFY